MFHVTNLYSVSFHHSMDAHRQLSHIRSSHHWDLLAMLDDTSLYLSQIVDISLLWLGTTGIMLRVCGREGKGVSSERTGREGLRPQAWASPRVHCDCIQHVLKLKERPWIKFHDTEIKSNDGCCCLIFVLALGNVMVTWFSIVSVFCVPS